MAPLDLVTELRRRPFVPLCLHVDDGTVYVVSNPELAMVGLDSAVICTPAREDPRFYERYDVVALRHITRLELRPDQSNRS